MNLIVHGVNLKPGSKVLLNAPDEFTLDELNLIKSKLEAQFIGVEFIFISGVELIGVYDDEVTTLQIEG